jgi:ABC-2 type transport system ATP-binding protein
MKQRLAIAAGLLRPRDLMILDEPTNGLDPQGTREVRGLIRQIAADGTTVFVSSHLLAEVEQISSHVGVMRAGQLVFEGSLDQLRGRDAVRIRVRTPDPDVAAQVLAGLGLADIQRQDGQISAQLGEELPEDVCARLVHAGVRVAGLDTPRASLEDLFVELTGEGFDVNG